MTDDAAATCNGHRLIALRVDVANVGPWIADLDFESDPTVSGHVEIRVGRSLTLVGTVTSVMTGVHLEQRKCRVIAGAGGWARGVTRKSYHNDAGVKARLVAEDLAREVGETLGEFMPAADRIGVDYVRQAGPASRVLEHVIGDGVPWWIDYAGRTCVGPRPAAGPIDGYDVLAYDPRQRSLTIAVDEPGRVRIGTVIAQPPLASPQTIREYELHIDAKASRVVAWCGGGGPDRGRLAGLLSAIARRATDGDLWGKYRYRVVAMRDDGRVDLQAVRAGAGLPDLRPVQVWPGVAGAAAELAPGAEVLVEFIEGDPTMPIVTHFAGVAGPGFVPVSLAFCGSEQRAARQGDLVQSGGAGCTCVLTPLAPVPGPLTPGTPYLISFSSSPADVGPLAKPLFGAISSGSPWVKL